MRLLPRTRGGALWRFFLAAVLVIGATAATTAVAGLLQFKQLATDLSVTPALPHANVTLPPPGAPQTILIIGSDHRAGTPYNAANTDTMMLVRLNPNSDTINVMSIPRDLQVEIPGFGTAKLNAAYADGGPNLLIKTIQQNVFPSFHPSHLIDINFGGFQALVNAIGCVYTDVDHRYYNNTALTDYSSINLQPGYEKLCGGNALSFVRFRHTDTDLVRNARQQDFIRWAKDQYSVGQILNNKDSLLRIFGAHTQTDHDLHTTDGLINLFNLVVFSAGHTIKQVKFPAILEPCTQTSCFVTASTGAEAAVWNRFMRATTASAPKPAVTTSSSAGRGRRHGRPASVTAPGLITDLPDGRAQVAALGDAGMPVYYPKLIVGGSSYCSDLTSVCPLEQASPGSYPRKYVIRDRANHVHAAYRITLVLNASLGQYYGVQGMTWQDPPILQHPYASKLVNGKQLELYEQGGSITDVAWHTPQGVYWISNTLTTDIANGQMIAIAASLAR